MTSGRGVRIHHTYDDVLAALVAVEPATTNRVFLQLEGRQPRATGAARRRRRWVWQALLNMANAGTLEYVIEPSGAYIWQTRKRRRKEPA